MTYFYGTVLGWYIRLAKVFAFLISLTFRGTKFLVSSWFSRIAATQLGLLVEIYRMKEEAPLSLVFGSLAVPS